MSVATCKKSAAAACDGSATNAEADGSHTKRVSSLHVSSVFLDTNRQCSKMVACGGNCWRAYARALGVVDRNVNRALGALGASIARRPLFFIVVPFLIAVGLSAGMVRIPSLTEERSEKLWCEVP
jgi:hypothetical protein